jgi:hypothetical protein
MIVKDSQLQTEWPVIMTPAQREQLVQEKLARALVWHQTLKKQYDKQKKPHDKRS